MTCITVTDNFSVLSIAFIINQWVTTRSCTGACFAEMFLPIIAVFLLRANL